MNETLLGFLHTTWKRSNKKNKRLVTVYNEFCTILRVYKELYAHDARGRLHLKMLQSREKKFYILTIVIICYTQTMYKLIDCIDYHHYS